MNIDAVRPTLTVTGPDAVTVAYDEVYATTPPDLWHAVTDPERLARWFAPVTGDFRPGGTVEIGFDDAAAPVRILTCGERSYSFEWPQSWGSTQVTVRVLPERPEVPEPQSARLQVVHESLTRTGAGQYGPGWGAYLGSLEALLAREEPTPWWERFEALRPIYRGWVEELPPDPAE